MLAAALLAPAAKPLAAQTEQPTERLSGTVVLEGSPVASVPVTLHRVTADTSGVIGSTTTDASGGFTFELPPPARGSFTVFFATAEHRSVRYFGEPVHPGDNPDSYLVELRDTTSAGDALRISRRDIVLIPHADGGWEVNEVVRLMNTGTRTVVSAGGMPTWEMGLPAGAGEFEAGAGDLPTDQVRRMGDRMLLLAPVLPGEREIFLRYRMPPAGSADLPVGTAMDSINFFVQQPAPGLTIAGVRPVDMITVEGQRFVQMSAAGLAADSVLRMRWKGGSAPIDPVWAGVGASLLFVLVGAGAAVRNSRR